MTRQVIPNNRVQGSHLHASGDVVQVLEMVPRADVKEKAALVKQHQMPRRAMRGGAGAAPACRATWPQKSCGGP
jgi:hypothetical protein